MEETNLAHDDGKDATTVVPPESTTLTDNPASHSNESISEEEYLERLHERYNQDPESAIGVCSQSSTFTSPTSFFHVDTAMESVLSPLNHPATSFTPRAQAREDSDFVPLDYASSTSSIEKNDLLDEGLNDNILSSDLDYAPGNLDNKESKVEQPPPITLPQTEVPTASQPPPSNSSPSVKVAPPFDPSKRKEIAEFEKMELSKFHLPPVPTFKKKMHVNTTQSHTSGSAIQTPPSVLKLIQQQYNILHHNTVQLFLSNKNSKVVVPTFNNNVVTLARTSSLACNVTSAFGDKVQVKIFNNVTGVGNDELYLTTQTGLARITSIELNNVSYWHGPSF